MKTVFAGSGEFGLPTLQELLNAGHEIVQVVSQPDRPAGRGRHLTPTPIARFAEQRGLPLLKTPDMNRDAIPRADLLIVIAFGQRIAERHVSQPRLGGVNLHASLLPKLRGAAPINAAILNGDTVTGNSVIRLAQTIDAGAILGQSRIEIAPLETAGELHDRLAIDGARLMLDVVDQLAAGTAVERAQDDALATRAPKLSRESARIDFARPAEHIARQIRAMHPWPGCRVRVVDSGGEMRGELTLVRAQAVSAAHDTSPAVIRSDGAVACAVGALELIEVQPPGRRAMRLDEYRNGHPWHQGMRLESI